MKLAVQTAGITASGVMSMAILTSVFYHQSPWDTLSLGIPAALLAAFIGYHIGNTLSRPKHKDTKSKKDVSASKQAGKAAKKLETKKSTAAEEPAAGEQSPELLPITGDETFLDDLPVDTSLAAAASKEESQGPRLRHSQEEHS